MRPLQLGQPPFLRPRRPLRLRRQRANRRDRVMKFPDPTVPRYGLGVVEFCFEGCEAEAEAEGLSVAFAGKEFVLEDLVDV